MVSNPAQAPVPVLTAEQQYAALVQSLPRSVAEFTPVRPDFPYEISAAYHALKQDCPALHRVNMRHPWNLSKWLNDNVSAEEWRASPFQFRQQAFRAAAVQGNTEVKTELLSKLYPVIPFHPGFIEWFDAGRIRFNTAINNDEFLKSEKKDWKHIVRDDARLRNYILHVQSLFFKSILERDDIKPTALAIVENRDLRWRGAYEAWSNKITLNFIKNGPNYKSSANVDGVVAHESFHAVQNLFSGLVQVKLRIADPAFNDTIEKFFYGSDPRLAMISSSVHYEGYFESFKERSARYAARAVGDNPHIPLMSQDKHEMAMVKKLRLNQGADIHMPAACAIS